MRILFILHQFFPEFSGGTERVAFNLARMAQKAGHHVHVLASTVDPVRSGGIPVPRPFSGSLRTNYQGIPVTVIPRTMLPPAADIGLEIDKAVVGALAEWMDDERFDVAHVLHTMRMGSAVLAAQRCGLPYVLTLTDFYLPCAQINLVTLGGAACSGPDEGRHCARECLAPPWTPDSYRQRYRQAASLITAAAERAAPSGYVAERYRESFPAVPFRVIPHGIDLIALAGAAPKDAVHPVPGALRLAYVGGVIPQKGLDVLLRALALLPGRDLSLKVIGGFHGNPGFHREVRSMAAADPRVSLIGALAASEVFAALKEVDLLCLPSLVPETYSLALHESAAVGVPAIVSDLGAPAERVAQWGSGLVVANGEPRAWAAAIQSVLDQPVLLQQWKDALPLPLRVEEEAFFYESLYRCARRYID
jgi:glycosyltransferase involved in cell wall biosynthesis